NVGYKLYEETDLPLAEVDKRVEEVLGFIDLGEHIDKMPSELSGGQRRRVSIARAMAFKPSIMLYDEATTGLDPITATTVDDEMLKLRDLENVSSIIVTHQLRDAFYVATHMAERDAGGRVQIVRATPAKEREAEFIMLKDVLIIFEGDGEALRKSTDPYIRISVVTGRTGEVYASHTLAGLVGVENRYPHDYRRCHHGCADFQPDWQQRIL